MAQLNLLPWRELRRKELNTQVRNVAIGIAILMAGLVYWAYLFMGGMIDEQNQRNSFLEQEIKKVEKELKEVNAVKSSIPVKSLRPEYSKFTVVTFSILAVNT